MDNTHECPVGTCRARVAPQHLMCGFHWRMVPQELRSVVWRAWRGGLGLGSPEHIDAMMAAVDAAAAGAGRSGG